MNIKETLKETVQEIKETASGLKGTASGLKGTASELKENSAYDKLVKLVGESGALHAIKTKLQEHEITEEEWKAYRKVRSAMHSNPLEIDKIFNEINSLADEALDC
jgi:replicative DNA helicase